MYYNRNSTSVPWLNRGLWFSPKKKWVWRLAVKGWCNGSTRSSETQVPLPFCFSTLVYDSLYQDHKMSSLHQCHNCLLREGKIQRTESEQVTPAVFPLLEVSQQHLPSTSAYILLSLPRGSHDLHWPQGVWEDGYLPGAIAAPKQMRPLLVRKNIKIGIEKQLTESAKKTTIHWGLAMC